MSEDTTTSSRMPVDDLLAYCYWLVDAHEDGDPQQIVAARCGLYEHLLEGGWAAPARPSLLMRLHAWTVAVEHDQLLVPARDQA